MNNKKELQIFLNDTIKNNIIDVTNLWKIYLSKKDILRIFHLSKWQIEIYLLRNKDIKTIKNWKETLIEIKILDYVFKSIARKKKI